MVIGDDFLCRQEDNFVLEFLRDGKVIFRNELIRV